jgi:hypothetical protein
MNLGFSGPMAERGVEVLKGRGLAAFRHLNRGRDLNWPVGSEGSIVNMTCAGSRCADEVVSSSNLRPLMMRKYLAHFLAPSKPHRPQPSHRNFSQLVEEKIFAHLFNPQLQIPNNSALRNHIQDGYRKEGSGQEGPPGQGRRWHGQRQNEGRKLLSVCFAHCLTMMAADREFLQLCEEGQDLEYVQGWKSTKKCYR